MYARAFQIISAIDLNVLQKDRQQSDLSRCHREKECERDKGHKAKDEGSICVVVLYFVPVTFVLFYVETLRYAEDR